jgi:hypothetical protein
MAKVTQMMMHEECSTTQNYLVADAGEALICHPTNGEGMRVGWERFAVEKADFSTCAAHDETVSGFGRNDGLLAVGRGNAETKQWQRQRLYGPARLLPVYLEGYFPV